MLLTHKLTLGTPLHVSHSSSQDATPAISAKVTPIGGGNSNFGPYYGSISLTAGAELFCSYSKKPFCLPLSSLSPESLQVFVTR